MGGMVILPRLVRDGVMRRLIYTAEPVSALQAERWGLVTEIDSTPLEAVLSLAKGLNAKGLDAMRTAKRLCAMAHTASEEGILLPESQCRTALIGKPEQMEVVAARLQRRPPKFN